MRKQVGIVCFLAFIFPLFLFSKGFKWNNLPLGGGGFLTGIVVHPYKKDLLYARTDVGGIYRFEPASGSYQTPRWKQLMNWIPVEQAHLWGCDGIGLNPQNDKEVYALLGSASYYGKPYGLYKSSDRGENWTQLYETKCRGNENLRWVGEPIAVQPVGKGSIVIVGTRFDGVIRSEDGGATWNKVTSIPADPDGNGVRCVVFNPQNPSIVYALDQWCVWRSEDAGKTFGEIMRKDGLQLRKAVVTTSGICYMTTNDGLYFCDSESFPERLYSFNKKVDLNALSVDIQDSLHLVVAEQKGGFDNKIYRTVDGGKSWQDITEKAKIKNHVPWYEHRHFAAALASLVIDPHQKHTVWFTDWFLPWKCENVNASEPLWESVPWGVEELVVFDMVSPPNEPLLYQGCADNGGFTHYTVDEYPTVWYDNQESTGLDFCEAYPECVVRVSSLGWGDSNFRLSFSEDCGKSWKDIGGEIHSTGKVAYSSRDRNNFIFAPTGNGQKIMYTLDKGKSPMKESAGLSAPGLNTNFWDNWNRHIVSDRINGKKFYVVMPGKFFVSEDGGESFALVNDKQIPHQAGVPAFYLASSPYREGEIWMSTGASGLFRSTDSGKNFEKAGDFTSSKCVAIGPALKGDIPVVYVFGQLEGVWGVYWSRDNARSWERINDDRMQLSNNPRQMAADRKHPGRIYIGTGGNGIIYGEYK